MKKTVNIISILLLFSVCSMSFGMGVRGNDAADAIGEDVTVVKWDFADDSFKPDGAHSCNIKVEDGLLKIDVTGNPMIFLPKIDIEAPVKMKVKMKSGGGAFGRFEVYWRTKDSTNFTEDKCVRYNVTHDNQWHEYEIPIPAVGTITQFRIDPGWKPGKFEIDYIAFISDRLGAKVKERMGKLPEKLSLENDILNFDIYAKEHRFEVVDKRTKRKWTADASKHQAYLVKAVKKNGKTIELELLDHSIKTTYKCVVELKGEILSFDIDTNNRKGDMLAINKYPPRFESDMKDGRLIFCNRSSGVLVDQRDDHKDFRSMRVYGNLSLDMPWVGVIEGETGDGLMLLTETPYDVDILLEKDKQGRGWPQVSWLASLDSFGYGRRMSYRFLDKGGYVGMANMYRDYARQTGKLITLEEKARKKPNVELIKGAPPIWGSVDGYEFVLEARARGITRAIMSNVHHAMQDTSKIKELNEMGYVTNEYGNFSDIFHSETRVDMFQDNIEKACYHMRPGLGAAKGWVTEEGIQYYMRSSGPAVSAVKKYLPGRLEKYGFNGRFIDVSMALDLFEDWHPEHTFGREQDMLNRREIFEFVNDYGLAFGTEHGNDWGIDLVEYTEGAASGPFWWAVTGNWKPGHLRRATDRSDISDDYLKYGMSYDLRIPLWQLVYHDCAVSTWYWGDVQGFINSVAPELADRKDLFNILYGAVPLFWRDDVGYDWHGSRDRFLKTYHETCKVNEEIAFDQMMNHEFISDDKSLQRTTYSSGTVCVVNFSDKPVEYYDFDAKRNVNIAGVGFYVTGPNIFQSKEVVDGQVITMIAKDGYLRVETESKTSVNAVEVDGLVTMFKLEDDRWNITADTKGKCKVDLSGIKGFDIGKAFRVFEIDDKGAYAKEAKHERNGNVLSINLDGGRGMYSLLLIDDSKILILPDKKEIDVNEAISISFGIKNAKIYYTLDGSSPGVNSKLYAGPFNIGSSKTIRAKAFDANGNAVAKEVKAEYRVAKQLYDSGFVTGKDKAMSIDLNVEGMKTLVLKVTDGNSYIFNDYANWADAKLIDKSGNEVYLSSLEPSVIKMDHFMLGIDSKVRPDEHAAITPIMLEDKKYERGIGCGSPAQIEYDLGGNYKRFTAVIGLDDSVKDKGKVEFKVLAVPESK